MNSVRHIAGATHFCATASRSGTVLMETVLVLPILTLLIFAIVQFALIWYAQIMTQYAAYNAARATLVYHPSEYSTTNGLGQTIFLEKSGPCWKAACRTLAWVSSSPEWNLEGKGSAFSLPGWWPTGNGCAPIPNASHIEQQVRIVENAPKSEEMTNAPVVRVTVEFDYPLHVPVIGRMIAYFDKVEKDNPSQYEVWGWSPEAEGMAALDTLKHKTMAVDFITLTETAILAKPYRTTHFGRIPSDLQKTVLEEIKLEQLSPPMSDLARKNQ